MRAREAAPFLFVLGYLRSVCFYRPRVRSLNLQPAHNGYRRGDIGPVEGARVHQVCACDKGQDENQECGETGINELRRRRRAVDRERRCADAGMTGDACADSAESDHAHTRRGRVGRSGSA